ncbi:hypA-like protein [Rhizodiscina lignyota]|uniref:HypA-like protein n=1 Tax=Rhizodiscina lignyota TaxID=1504668 RepID=A0A9P4I9S8_9PEZI|nr:hypA-like protein [Rhizodiscina lignyota]
MATPSKVQLDTSLHPVFFTALKKESADKASELLQDNHDNHHIFFNKEGFHNHIAHHLLTIYALGATPEQLQKGYDRNSAYQRSPIVQEEKVFEQLHDPAVWKKCLGNEKYYHDYLVFFQKEMESKGWEAVVNEYLFSRTEQAEDMLVRLFAGFLHPLIHLGFGMEFRQPAIMCEALAQTAVHDRWIGGLLLEAEKTADRRKTAKGEKSIPELLEEIQRNERLKNSPHWADGNKVRDGILKRDPDDMLEIASQFVVQESQLEKKMMEMMNAAIYFTAAAQRPNKSVKMDFYYMHCVNSSIFFPSFLSPDSPLSTASKIRLLEWKGRIDLALYASRRAPPLLLSEVTSYRPKKPSGWQEIFERVKNFNDDGHASKMLRTVAAAEELCRKWEARPGEGEFIGDVDMRVQSGMWLQIGHMIIDSVEGWGGGEEEPRWGRSVGFDEAWVNVPDRAGPAQAVL